MELLAVQVTLVLLLTEQFHPVGGTKVSGLGKSVYVLLMLNRTAVILSPALLLFATRKVIGRAVPMGSSTDAGVCAMVNERVASAEECQQQTSAPTSTKSIFLILCFIRPTSRQRCTVFLTVRDAAPTIPREETSAW